MTTGSGNPHVGVLFIGTGKYVSFFDGFYETFERHLFAGARRTFFVYSDVQPPKLGGNICWIRTPSEPWPLPTLNRYDYFLKSASEWIGCTHMMFANSNLRPQVDMAFDEFFDDRIGLFGVRHPGFAYAKRRFYKKYPGTFETNRQSTAYVGRGPRTYFAGGLNGGTTLEWLKLCGFLSVNIEQDKRRKVNGTGWAIWHDESQINHYFNRCKQPKALGPEYLYPEGWNLPCEKKILILDKQKYGGHAYLRNEPAETR